MDNRSLLPEPRFATMTDPIVEREKLQPQSWYVLRDGELSQPMSESQVCEFVLGEQLTDEVRIRQGESDFFPVSEVRMLFAALRDQGWYVRSARKLYGPFVGEKFLALVATEFFKRHLVIDACQSNLLDVVLTLNDPCCLSSCLDGGKEKPDEDRDNGHHDEEFN